MDYWISLRFPSAGPEFESWLSVLFYALLGKFGDDKKEVYAIRFYAYVQ